METNCISCNQSIIETATFCYKCGSQQKCKSCDTAIIKGANNCMGCGISLSPSVNTESVKAVNTIEFNENASSRSYKVAFTDNVGATVVDVVKNMLENQMGKQQLKLGNGGPSSDNNSEQKTEDAISEDVTFKADVKSFENSEIPHIDDVKNTLECSETNWILIYSFYISNNGKDGFNKADAYAKYKDQRGTRPRLSNFSIKWKSLFKGFIRTVKDGELRLTEKGVETVLGLISKKIVSKPGQTLAKSNGSSKSKKEDKSEPVKKTAKTSAKSVAVEEFDAFKTTKKPSLEDFLKDTKVGDNTYDRILAIAYYIINHCKSDSFSEGNIEYAYKVLGLNKRPTFLYQTILNAKTKYAWYDKEGGRNTGKWKLARAGEIHFEEKLKK